MTLYFLHRPLSFVRYQHKKVAFALSQLFICCILSAVSITPIQAEEKGKLSINFRNVDIGLVIESVSRLTNKNFILDPRVNGRVTLLANNPVNEDELYEVLLTVLHVYGFAAISSKDIIKIVPAAIARSYAPGYKETNNHALITEVISIVNNSAQQLEAVLRPMLSQNAHLVALANGNSLVVSDVKINIERIKQIIKKIDTVQKRDYDIIQLNHAPVQNVMGLVQSIYKNNNQSLALNLQADERTNRIILSASPEVRLAVKALIAGLDTPLKTGGNVRVLYLKYAKAESLVPVIDSLLQSESFKSISAASSGNSSAAPAAPATPTPTPTPQPSSSSNSASNATLAETSVTADKDLNALIISGSASTIDSLQVVISQLDIPRAQIAIEVIIAELSDSRINRLGFDWISNTSVKAISDLSGGLAKAVAAQKAGGDGAAAASFASGQGFVTGAASGTIANGWAMLLQAIDSDSQSNVLSTPYIITLDNVEANFVVGDNVPFITGSATGTNNANPFTTIKRQKVGINLKVKPQISGTDMITLELAQEISSVKPNNISASDLVTSLRQISTTVQVRNGGILALGGLQQDRQFETNNRVPILGSIPLIGRLFRYQSTEMRKTTLMLFLRPRILQTDSDVATLSYAKYHKVRSLQLFANQQESFALPGERPLLPSLQSLPLTLDLGSGNSKNVTFSLSPQTDTSTDSDE